MSKTVRKYKGQKYYDKDRTQGVLGPDRSCLHGGNCEWCSGNRTHRNKRNEPILQPEDYMLTEE